GRLEFMVVHDHFMTPTARYADVVLPATTFWERNDVHTPWAGAGHYAIFMKKAIEPIGECRNDLDICADLAARLGVQGYSEKSGEGCLRALAGRPTDHSHASRKHAVPRLPPPEDPVASAQETRAPERLPFSPPSGKIEISSMTRAANPAPCGLGTIPPI